MEHIIEQFIIVFNAVVPAFLLMGLGWLVRRQGLVGDKFFQGLSRLAFMCFFPTLLFLSVYGADMSSALNPSLVLYFIVSFTALFGLLWALAARYVEDKQKVAAFVQAGYRSNYIVLAMAIVVSLMGPEAIAPTALLVPFTSVVQTTLAAIVFTVVGQSTETSGLERVKGVVIGILKMPMILGALLAVAINLVGLSLPVVATRGLSGLADLAIPAGLIGIGGIISLEKVRSHLRFAITTTVVKNIVTPILLIVPAIFLGFRGIELAIIAMLGLSPLGAAAYITALEMGSERAGEYSASVIVLSNAVGIFTIVPALTILRVLGLF